MLIGSPAYFAIVWTVLILWGVAVAALVALGVRARSWALAASGLGCFVGGILFAQVLSRAMS
jgi:hypothetical protein